MIRPITLIPMARNSTTNTPMGSILLSLYAWPLYLIVSCLLIPFLSLLVALTAPFRSHRANMIFFRKMIVLYGKISLKCLYPFVRIQRTFPLAGLPQPCIYICNHRSSLDPFLMALLQGDIVQVVNIWPFRIPVLGRYAKWAGYLSVREMPFDTFSLRACSALESGTSIAAFPEGTRSVTGQLGAYHSTLFRVALASKVPVVPVCMIGNEQVLAKNSWWFHPGTIQVRALRPVCWEEYKDWSPFIFKNRIRDLMESAIAEMEVSQHASSDSER